MRGIEIGYMEITVLTLVVDDVGETKQKTLKIEYEITSGSLNDMTSDVNSTSLTLNITANESGKLHMTIPRIIIDSKSTWDGNIDDIFYMVIDGEEVDYTETVTEDHRTLEIPYMEGSEVIEIIGTTVIDDLYTIGDNLAVATMIGM